MRGRIDQLQNVTVRMAILGLILPQISHPPRIKRMAKEAVLETVLMTYGDDGILRIKINEGAHMTLAQAKLQLETIRRLCGNKRVPILVDARVNYSTTKEAHEFSAQHEEIRLATAVISSNNFTKVSLNLYLSIFKPSTPYKLFSKEQEALAWLNEQIRLHNKS